jgi:hypothetical protein
LFIHACPDLPVWGHVVARCFPRLLMVTTVISLWAGLPFVVDGADPLIDSLSVLIRRMLFSSSTAACHTRRCLGVTLSPGSARVEAMPTYRLYALDNHEHIAGPPQIITCDTDEEAIQRAQFCGRPRPGIVGARTAPCADRARRRLIGRERPIRA